MFQISSCRLSTTSIIHVIWYGHCSTSAVNLIRFILEFSVDTIISDLIILATTKRSSMVYLVGDHRNFSCQVCIWITGPFLYESRNVFGRRASKELFDRSATSFNLSWVNSYLGAEAPQQYLNVHQAISHSNLIKVPSHPARQFLCHLQPYHFFFSSKCALFHFEFAVKEGFMYK